MDDTKYLFFFFLRNQKRNTFNKQSKHKKCIDRKDRKVKKQKHLNRAALPPQEQKSNFIRETFIISFNP